MLANYTFLTAVTEKHSGRVFVKNENIEPENIHYFHVEKLSHGTRFDYGSVGEKARPVKEYLTILNPGVSSTSTVKEIEMVLYKNNVKNEHLPMVLDDKIIIFRHQ